jgi:hypothetical protein
VELVRSGCSQEVAGPGRSGIQSRQFVTLETGFPGICGPGQLLGDELPGQDQVPQSRPVSFLLGGDVRVEAVGLEQPGAE